MWVGLGRWTGVGSWTRSSSLLATDCQWRALTDGYPNRNTVHRYHLEWCRDGTWEGIAARLAAAVRKREGPEVEPSADSGRSQCPGHPQGVRSNQGL